MELDIQLQDKDIREQVQRMVARGQDLTPAMAAIAAHLLTITEQAFEDQKDPATGQPWAELSETTKSRRRKGGYLKSRKGRGESFQKLQVTRHLLDSILPDSDRYRAAVGTNLAYAATHQYGAHQGEFGFGARAISNKAGKAGSRAGGPPRPFPIPWGDIPARPFFGLPDQGPEIDKIMDILANHLGIA